MSEAVKTQLQSLIADAKAYKSAKEMANMDYKYAMKKIGMLAEQYPEIAKELNILPEEGAEGAEGSEGAGTTGKRGRKAKGAEASA